MPTVLERTEVTGVPPERFRRAMGAHAAGVVVVTVRGPQGPAGMTVTSFTSVSVRPPLASFYIADSSGTWPAVRDSDAFAVNILAADQHELATRFAARGGDRFAPPTRWSAGPLGMPLLEGTLGHVACLRHDVHAVGDHWLVVGRVVDEVIRGGRSPLLYHRGRYGHFDAIDGRSGADGVE